MLLILSMALLPLGLMALFASIHSAAQNRLQHEADARIIASASARQIDETISRSASALRAVLASQPPDVVECRRRLAMLQQGGTGGLHFALYSNGRRYCATPGYPLRAALPPRGMMGTELLLAAAPPSVRFIVADGGGNGSYGIGVIPRSALAKGIESTSRTHGVTLTQGTTRVVLSEASGTGPLDQQITVQAPIAGSQIGLVMTANVTAVSATEILLLLLPLMMWVAAAIIGWLVVDRLLLRPLLQLQRAISGHRAEDGPLQIPPLTTPSHEIRNLARAFQTAADELAGHEAELEQGLARQTRLTREVHHRVKNNLQVVASLINLHARGAEGDVAKAYASIQRRVDALAVVHRNHYAELEENRGVGLRALLGELAANLRATAPQEAAHMTVTLHVIPVFASQDIAVPIAFLVTEIVELVISCDPRGTIALSLLPGSAPGRAVLGLEATGLRHEACMNHPTMERFRRITEGLARQLRSKLHYDEHIGRYEIEISVVPDRQES